MRKIDSVNKTIIRAIVGAEVEGYAIGFKARHEAEVDI